MSILSRFPILDGLIEEASADALHVRYLTVCAQAGVHPDTPEAEPIGIHLIADFVGGWHSNASVRSLTAT